MGKNGRIFQIINLKLILIELTKRSVEQGDPGVRINCSVGQEVWHSCGGGTILREGGRQSHAHYTQEHNLHNIKSVSCLYKKITEFELRLESFDIWSFL